MDALAELRTLLATRFVASTPAAPTTTPVSHALARVRQMRQRRATTGAAPQLTATLFRLRLGEGVDRRGLARLCATLHRPVGWEQRRPLDDLALLERLLAGLETIATDDRAFRRCYRALLASYLALPATDVAAGHPGGQTIGRFLRRHYPRALAASGQGAWLPMLSACRPLLADPPDTARMPTPQLRMLCLRLGVPSTGWASPREK